MQPTIAGLLGHNSWIAQGVLYTEFQIDTLKADIPEVEIPKVEALSYKHAQSCLLATDAKDINLP